MPVFALTLHRNGLNLAVNRAMQFDLDVAHALHEQMTAWQQLVPVSVRRKRDAVEAAVRLEARKACLLLALHTFKECFERLVQTAKNLLSTVAIRQAKVTHGSNFGQLGCLVVVVDALAVRCVCFDALLKCRIIAAGFRQLYTQALGLSLGRVQPVFERLAHQRPFWFSMYFFTVASETWPTVGDSPPPVSLSGPVISTPYRRPGQTSLDADQQRADRKPRGANKTRQRQNCSSGP